MIATLGRVEDLRESGQLERLLRSGARFAAKAIVVDAVAAGDAPRARRGASAGAGVRTAVGRDRLPEVVEDLAGARKHDFALERAVFLTVLHRLFAGGSFGQRTGGGRITRSMVSRASSCIISIGRWLGSARNWPAATGRGHPVCTALSEGRRRGAPVREAARSVHHARSRVHGHHQPVFRGRGGQSLGRHGFSKDHRPDLSQMILAVLLDGDGRPVCTEMWPGNTADTGSLVPVVDRFRQRFSIRICTIADRGMISAETIAELEARRLLYILGVRERTDKLVRELVLDDPAPFVPLVMTRRKSVKYEAKAVDLAGRRYSFVAITTDEERRRRPGHDPRRARTTIEEGRQGPGRQRGISPLPGDPRRDIFAIDRAKAEEDAKFDGVFVLRTNTDLSPLDTMLCYKQLTMVEQAFRTSKSLFETRPIFHQLDETIRGHVSCSFLALVLKKDWRTASWISASRPPTAARQAVLARHSRRSQLADRDRGRTGRQAVSPTLRGTPRRKPRAPRRRRRPAANRPPARRPLIPTVNQPKCSAKALFQRRSAFAINALPIHGVEDQPELHELRLRPFARRAPRLAPPHPT